jgi:mannose-6-phosphate isomerase-like protein (cupin superfamily)
VTLTKWDGSEKGIVDMATGYPAHNCIEWEAGSATPYPSSNVKFSYDTTYFVAQGNVSITVDGVSKTIHTGDTLWIKAGTVHSAITPVDNKAGVILDACAKPYMPEAASEMSLGRGFAANGDLTHRFYLATDLKPPSPTSRGMIHHYEWYAQATSDIDVLHVWWDIGASIGCHSHPEGALYVPSWGEICFFSEQPSDCRVAGEARWTRPGFEYDYEGTGPEGTQIIVLNAHSGPQMCEAPSPFEI